MLTLIQDCQNNHPMLLSSYGNNLALGFKGEPDFIERCYNWTVNTGVIGKGARLTWYYERFTGRLAYVCPKSKEAIIKGLILQFAAEIIQSREIPPLKDIYKEDIGPILELDEIAIEKLASSRAELFMLEHVVQDDFVLNRPASLGEVYSMGPVRRKTEEN